MLVPHGNLLRSVSWRVRAAAVLSVVAALLVAGAASAQLIPPPAKPPGGAGLEEGSPTLPKVNVPPPKKKPAPAPSHPTGQAPVEPFGAKLFQGNFLGAREDGVNPEYVILPGDRVAVYSWGTVELQQTFIVDAQGNIFLPGVGPIQLGGVPNRQLTQAVRRGMERVYSSGFDVYTNLITSSPVAVFVTGGVDRPGRYAGIPNDSPLFFLDQAGGIDPNLGSYRKVKVLRGGTELVRIDLYDFLLRGTMPPVQFADGDTILVERRGPVIELRGDVAQAAMIEFPEAPVKGAEALEVIPGVARATQVTVQGVRDDVPISRTLSVADFRTFAVHDGDTIYLRADGLSESIVVSIEGEIKGPSKLAVRRGVKLVDVLNVIPVDPTLADVDAVHIRRPSVAQAQKDSIDDSLFRLERSALLALSQSNGESNIRVKEAELTLQFVERARLIQPLGRVVTAHHGVQQNLQLQDGDVIVVPPRSQVVRIGGEVMMTQAVMFRPDAVAGDYIADAGGYTDRGDEGKVIVIHANAEVTIGDADTPIRAGDEVLVPPRVDTKYLQNISDVTTVIYQVAVSAAVIITLALL